MQANKGWSWDHPCSGLFVLRWPKAVRNEDKEEYTEGTCYDRGDANFSEGDQNQWL